MEWYLDGRDDALSHLPYRLARVYFDGIEHRWGRFAAMLWAEGYRSELHKVQRLVKT